ncbi:MAG TPA: aldehyde dehydrogenase family protein, partial [Dehalococcoidia bacterium]|nr:aldehyde dehydrogenase family protein [Dehalococcoidia bacterium]
SEPVADELAKKIVALTETLSVGLPEENAVVTPLIDGSSADFVQELIDDAVRAGAVPLTRIQREGNLLWPVVFDRVTADMRVAWEEPFGPVLPILRVKSADEAIAIANASEYGLQSSIFTRSSDAALRIAARLEVGTVQLNGKTSRGPDHFPFLGTKSSGLGTQGVYYSIEAMTRVKSVVFNIDDRTPLEELR